MFKKLNIILCIVVLCFSMLGCSSSSDTQKEKSTKVNTELPEEETATEVPKESLEFSDSFIKNMKDYASNFTYVTCNQKMTSYSLLDGKKSSEKVVADVSMQVDLKSQITLTTMETDFTDGVSTEYYFADDNKNNIHISKLDTGEYIASDTLKSNLPIDYSKVTSIYEFIELICSGQLPEKGTVAELKDNIYTFTVSRDANKTDLTGTDYDKLGTTTIVFCVEKDKDNNMIPKSIEMNTTFFVGQVEYGVSTLCSFSEYSTNELIFPEYVKVDSEVSDTEE